MTARLQILNRIFNGKYTKLVRSCKQKTPQFKVHYGKVAGFFGFRSLNGHFEIGYADFFNFKENCRIHTALFFLISEFSLPCFVAA